ncbi:MAG: efflux RND transporter periplasmic adaptor subunit [Verrucomicrobiota bacterium JB023]|nr:efflux RND transporter periplasmic adaptor subunit [Verrucomicrobiota bacterium JB023]
MSQEPANPGESTPDDQPRSQGGALRFIILLALVVAAVGYGLYALQNAPEKGDGAAAAPQTQPPSAVKVAAVETRQTRQTHRVTGTLRATSRAEVAANEDGAVLDILADEGDHVKANDVLVRLDGRRLEAQIAQAKAAITAARSLIMQREAEVARSETDLQVKQDLYRQKAISQSDFLDAEREFKVAESLEQSARDNLNAAAAVLQLLDVRRTDLVIRAPFDAQVVARHIEPGEWLRAGDPVMTLVSDGKLEAWLQVPERFAGKLATNDITLSVNGATYQAINARPLPEADPSSRATVLIADLADPTHSLLPGLSVTAEIAVSEDQNYLVVPTDSIVTTYAGPAVFRASSQGEGPPIAERLPIESLFQRDNLAYLAPRGLKEGDLVVIEGNERLFPMTPLAFEAPTKTEVATEPEQSEGPEA